MVEFYQVIHFFIYMTKNLHFAVLSIVFSVVIIAGAVFMTHAGKTLAGIVRITPKIVEATPSQGIVRIVPHVAGIVKITPKKVASTGIVIKIPA